MGHPVVWRFERISGILYPLRGDCHFSRPAVTLRLKRPTLRRWASNPFGIQDSIVSILGLAAHKVYPNGMSPPQCVSSYLTFSPLP